MYRNKSSSMVYKFLNVRNEDIFVDYTPTYCPKFYFFYGPLLGPDQLMRVLHLDERPVTLPASIETYSYKMWGSYPALIDAKQGSVVRGVAFEVTSKEMETRLEAEYQQTDMYRKRGTRIYFENGDPSLFGFTFMWKGSEDDPELREGSFDLREWQSKRVVVE